MISQSRTGSDLATETGVEQFRAESTGVLHSNVHRGTSAADSSK